MLIEKANIVQIMTVQDKKGVVNSYPHVRKMLPYDSHTVHVDGDTHLNCSDDDDI